MHIHTFVTPRASKYVDAAAPLTITASAVRLPASNTSCCCCCCCVRRSTSDMDVLPQAPAGAVKLPVSRSGVKDCTPAPAMYPCASSSPHPTACCHCRQLVTPGSRGPLRRWLQGAENCWTACSDLLPLLLLLVVVVVMGTDKADTRPVLAPRS